MSTYQLSTVRTRLNQKLDDTAFDTATANQFINDAQREILNSRRWVFMEREGSVTTTSGSTSLTSVPTTMQAPISMRVYSPTGNAIILPYVEYEDFDVELPNPTVAGSTAPSAWYVFDLVPYVYPTANGTYTLKLKYIKKPTELSNDTDVPEIPEEFSELLVLAAYKRALEFNDEDLTKVSKIEMEIEKHMSKMDDRYKRQKGTPHIMRQPNRRRIIGRI